ncbi:hypothetical protein ACYULU_02885 [Breznakiellaceae bacterium SP9]
MENALVEKTATEQQKREAAYALNLCTVSVSQIVDYADIYILEQEYDAILNNLNIQNIIHDDALLSVLKKILDTITFFKIQEGDKKFIEKEYQAKMKNAIWSAVPNLSLIIAGGNPITMAIGMATQIGVGYMSYRKTKSQAKGDKERQEWELERTAIEQFSALQRELFETAWRLSDKYNFDDRYRLTEKQIKHYNSILMDPDPFRRYERLDIQKDIFEAFPPFWYYKGNAAKEVAAKYKHNSDIASQYKAKALEDYRKFDAIYVELMREDVIAASCALEHIVLLDKEQDKDEIQGLLDRTMKLAGDNTDVLQIGALHYIAIGEQNRAKNLLRQLVNEDYNVSMNGMLLSRIYCKWDKNKAEYDILQDRIGKTNVIPWIEDDKEADQKYIESAEWDVFIRFAYFVNTCNGKHDHLFHISDGFDGEDEDFDRVSWCLNTDFTKLLVSQLNEFFEELLGMELFIMQKRLNNSSWQDFFKDQAALIAEKVKKFNKGELQIKDKIKEFNKAGNTQQLNAAYQALVERLDFSSFTKDFIENLKTEFRSSISVQSIISIKGNIDVILEKWYQDNGFETPTYTSEQDSDGIFAGTKKQVFFEYPDKK